MGDAGVHLRGLRGFERYAVGLVVATCVVAVLAKAAMGLDLARRKKALTAAIALERAALPERTQVLLDAVDRVVVDAAAEPWPGDLAADPFVEIGARRALLARQLLYVRAALPEIARLDAVNAAVRRSEKDTVALCLRHPPAERATGEEVRAVATRYWLGGALFDDATRDVLRLDDVMRGLRPLTSAFSAELGQADEALWVKKLEDEQAHRSGTALALARTAAQADLLLVVVDELPDGMEAPEVGPGLTASRRPAILPRIEDRAHVVRAVVWDAGRREVVLRLRTRVDAGALGLKDPERAASEVQGCQVAMALRGDEKLAEARGP